MNIEDDLYFEKELRRRIKERIIKLSRETNRRNDEEFSNPFNPDYEIKYDIMGCEEVSQITEDVLQDFDSVIELYYRKLYKEDESDTNFYEKYSIPFKEQFTDKKLYEAFNNIEFTEEEETYLKLENYKYRIYFDEYSPNYTFAKILLRRKIIETFGEESFQTFLDIIKNDMNKTKMYDYFSKLFSDTPYGENIIEEYEKLIEDNTTRKFNDKINCGGYAIKIDTPIFPPIVENQYKAVSKILDTYKFVRLLGDKPLEDDEYLVFYRWYKKDGMVGHHFVRADSDGMVREKNGADELRIFTNWAEVYQDSVQAVFAVKKDHKMFGYEWVSSAKVEGLDFEETAEKNIKERNNSFMYHDREYHFKKDNSGKVVIITNDNKIVAETIIEEDDCLVDVLEEQKDYVENVLGFTTPIIQNGKLVNLDAFKRQQRRDFEEER